MRHPGGHGKQQLASVLAAVGVLLALPAVAASATVQVSGGEVLYSALPGESNHVEFEFAEDPAAPSATVIVRETGAPLTPKNGCVPAPEGASCAVANQARVVAWLKDGNDFASDDRVASRGVNFSGGPGDDVLQATSYESVVQELDGGSGNDELSACCGRVRITGAGGADRIHVIEAHALQLDAGAGNDTVTFEGYGSPQADFPTWLRLGDGKDELTLGADTLIARATPYGTYDAFAFGEAAIQAGSNTDTLRFGGATNVTFDLAACDCSFERVFGTDADNPENDPWVSAGDLLLGNGEANLLEGGGGPDILIPRGGADTVRGGPGADRLITNGDGVKDVADCGTGSDRVSADRIDTVWGCELRGAG